MISKSICAVMFQILSMFIKTIHELQCMGPHMLTYNGEYNEGDLGIETNNHLKFLSAAGSSPLCLRIQANVNRVTVSSKGMLTTSLVSQSEYDMKIQNKR